MDTGCVGKLLDEDRGWLEKQPGMNPWQDGSAMLLQSLDTWLTQYSLAAAGNTTVSVPPAEDRGGPSAITDNHRDRCMHRMWRCWRHHWQQAVSLAADGMMDGREVARQIQRQEGYQGARQLGGNPLRDVVLAELVQQRDASAMQCFQQEYKEFCISQGVLVNKHVMEDRDDWWYCLLDHLGGYSRPPGKLGGFSGKCGLKFWLGTVARNFAHQYPPSPVASSDGDLDADFADKQGSEAVEDHECLELLSGFVRGSLSDLSSEDQLVLYLLHVEKLPGKDAARVLGVDAGTITRRKQKASMRLQTLMLERAEKLTRRQEYEDCLEVLSDRRNWRHFADIFCETLQHIGQETLPRHNKREVSR